ncbi:hypothetical protein [Aporhodopirellula aestuarii]|uniref:Uncharacterized protein n=1 Tax=Aporhodopirellula aestuarii TaxID=2950107 RepID=A0ABT0U1I1_9BACT|nr:hypothetical protein [Aporhodopirellula aestuarii]MCM2370710.1 hypothetical protein [Aporhodopirellula aestuarii]
MPAFRSPSFLNNDFGSVDLDLLRDFLLPFSDYFAARKFTISADISFDEDQFKKLARLLRTPTRSAPSELIEAQFHIDEVANDRGMESLILAYSKAGIPLPTDDELTPADLAMRTWMSHPELLRRSNYQRIATSQRSFRHYMNRHEKPMPFQLPTTVVINAMEKRLSTFNRDRHRGGGTALWMHDVGDVLAFVVRRGENLKRGEFIEGEKSRYQVQRPAGYDTILVQKQLGELHVHASLISEHREYCRLIGEYLFGDEDFFPTSELFDLSPIHELGEDIESPAFIDGIESVQLDEVTEMFMGSQNLTKTFRGRRIFVQLREHQQQLTLGTRITKAKFRFTLRDYPEVTATIHSGNIISYSRQVGVELIEAWMTHHGIKTTGVPRDPATPTTLANALSDPKPASTTASVAGRAG